MSARAFSVDVLHFLNKRAATEQGGLLSGKDPTDVNGITADPIRLWIIEVGVIIAMASLLGLLLRRIRQPKVIAEVLGGILLGPTAFGQIPGFTQHIFPDEFRPYLSLTANIGLCLFLFLVGLEIDAGIIIRNARLSAMIALAGMCLPFGLGVAIAVPLYDEFVDKSIKFTYFMLFAGVAFSITAFPVLCRILTELKLLDTTVGIVVLSAGVGNDIIGWVLLALSVALVNAGSGLTAVYILLCCVGWSLLMLFPARWGLHWLARATGSIENGPTMVFMTLTIVLLFGSAFFTDVIGVHAIFGAFLTGIIVPREGGLAISLTEKLEDMTSIIFLPLYFTLSGLSTDLTLLNNGITWGYTVAICVLAFTGKFGGCTIAARYAAGFSWRESSTIGSLMSCKGLVELIVLNVGLQANILSKRVFSMFVLEALVLTFITTPLVTVLYPPDKRVRAAAVGANFAATSDLEAGGKARQSGDTRSSFRRNRFTFVLDKLEHIPGMMAMSQLIQPSLSPLPLRRTNSSGSSTSKRDGMETLESNLSIDALRIIELSDRVSAVMRSSHVDALLHSDPLLSIFRMHAKLHNLRIQSHLSIVPYDDLAINVADHAREKSTDMIVMPWLPPLYESGASSTVDATDIPPPSPRHAPTFNPFDSLFKSAVSDASAAAIHSHFVRGVFAHANSTDVALFVDRHGQERYDSMVSQGRYHIFVPFFGGPDDRLALEFAAQLCESEGMRATVVRVVRVEPGEEHVGDGGLAAPGQAHLKDGQHQHSVTGADGTIMTVASVSAFPDTVYGHATTETRMLSETADNVCWARFTSPSSSVDPHGSPEVSPTVLSRMNFRTVHSSIPLQTAISNVRAFDERVLVIVGRSRRLAVENHAQELKDILHEAKDRHAANIPGSEVKKTVGDVASAFMASGPDAGSGIVVVQAAQGDA